MSSQSHHIRPLLFSKLVTCNYYRTISNILKFYYMQLEVDGCHIFIEREIFNKIYEIFIDFNPRDDF